MKPSGKSEPSESLKHRASESEVKEGIKNDMKPTAPRAFRQAAKVPVNNGELNKTAVKPVNTAMPAKKIAASPIKNAAIRVPSKNRAQVI